MQYYDPTILDWTDVTGTLYVLKNTSVGFKAIKSHTDIAWPSGKPVWGGTSGASGTGETKNVTFNTLSSSTTDYKTVTAECGNVVEANIIVFDVTGIFTPLDDFSGRSQSNYGLEEEVYLTSTIDPTGVTVAQAGGLQWTKHSGVGIVSNAGSGGTANYDAKDTAGGVTFHLTIQSGPSKDDYLYYSKTVVAPSNINFVRKPGTGIWHVQGLASVGFKGEYYLRPTNVSFYDLEFSEGSCSATLSGWYSLKFPSGYDHPEGAPAGVGLGDITYGCKVLATDTVSACDYPPPPYDTGSFIWPTPARYRAYGDWSTITTATYRVDLDSAGKSTIQKAGVGPFSKNLNDPDSSY